MADTPKHSVSVAGIVVDDQDRALVIQRRDNGHWEPPGGVLELDEAPEAGVAREVLEETGLRVIVDSLTGVYKNMTLGVVSLVFKCTPVGGEVHATSESRAISWMSVDEIELYTEPAYLVRFVDAFRDGVQVRVHDGRNLISTS